jgi:hypothetical protein
MKGAGGEGEGKQSCIAKSPLHRRYPVETKKTKKKAKKKKLKMVVRTHVETAALLVKEKEGSDGSPVSVCYRLTATNPKFTGLSSALNRIAAKAAAKLSVAPMISTKENVERILAEYKVRGARAFHP